MQTTDTRRKIFLDLEKSYRTFAANAKTEEDRQKWLKRAEENEAEANKFHQPHEPSIQAGSH